MPDPKAAPEPEAAFWPDFNRTGSILVCTACTTSKVLDDNTSASWFITLDKDGTWATCTNCDNTVEVIVEPSE